MQFGISVLIFGHNDVIPHLPLLNQYGIEYIEIRGYPPRIKYNDTAYIEKLRAALDKNKIKVHSFHLPFNFIDISSIDSQKRNFSVKEVLEGVELCKKIGCDLAILHTGAKYKENKKSAEESSFKSITEILAICEKYKIKLALENMLPGRVGEDFDFFDNVLKKINSPYLGLCFDSSHANANGVVYDFLGKTKNKLFTVHFSDSLGKSDDHFFPFKGNIDWQKIINILKKISYNSVFLLEVAMEEKLTPEEHLKYYLTIIEKLKNLS